MLIKKITTGFVVQTFDTDQKKFTEQEFVAGEQVDYEDESGDPVDEDLFEGSLPLEMVQPQAAAPVHFVVSVCGSIQRTNGKQPQQQDMLACVRAAIENALLDRQNLGTSKVTITSVLLPGPSAARCPRCGGDLDYHDIEVDDGQPSYPVRCPLCGWSGKEPVNTR